MKLLDTNTCIAFLNGESQVVEQFEKHSLSELRICSVVKAELVYVAYNSQRPAKNPASLERFAEALISLPFDDNCAELYGRIRAELKRGGKPIGGNDL